jgi:hypothetical protein
MTGQIFISYRREESRWSAGRLSDRLTTRFDRRQIFMDIDGIGLGEDFVETIEKRVGACDVLIAVIGAHWLTSADQHGGRRLDNPAPAITVKPEGESASSAAQAKNILSEALALGYLPAQKLQSLRFSLTTLSSLEQNDPSRRHL